MNILWNPRRFKKVALVLSCALAVYALLVYSTGYPTISGTIVDAETGQPVEGAVALCVWTYTTGMIERIHRIAKVTEGTSDSQGRVKIRGTWNIFVDPAELTIYKRGYVAWNNEGLFVPASEYRKHHMSLMRSDFQWKNGFVAKMEKWKDGYSLEEHESFISNHGGGGHFYKTLREWEKSLQPRADSRINEDSSKRGSSR